MIKHLSISAPASRGLLILTTIAALGACSSGGSSSGGGSSNNKSTAMGTFVDAPVEGLEYVSGGQSGLTDENGQFTYEVGGSVTFRIGDILIGTASGGLVITPLDLAGAGAQPTDPEVVNILRVLQTLDDDHNPANGIKITEAVRDLADAAMDFSLDPDDFASDSTVQDLIDTLTAATSEGAQELVNVEAALQHFLDTTSLFEFAGSYSGTFAGGDSGDWSFEIGADGSLVINSGDTFVTLSLDGEGEFSGTTADGCVYTGSIDSSGNVSGTWTCEALQLSGTFSGSGDGIEIPTTSNFAGDWSLVYTETGNNCGDPSEGSVPFTATVTQNGVLATVSVEGSESTAVVSGDTLTWFDAYQDGDGVTSETITLTRSGTSLSGTSNWVWAGIVDSELFECSGSGTVSGSCSGGACLP